MSRANLELGDTHSILAECDAQNLSRQEAAYVLATAFWESARTMEPVREAFWKSDGWRKDNLRYYPWFGRGYVQLTWERNYRHAGKQLGVDLTTDPDVAMRPDIAVKVLVLGMVEGWFTGKKLSDYFGAGRADYRNARRIINGIDKADTITTIAREYDRELAVMGYGGEPLQRDGVPDLEMGNTAPKALVMVLQQDLKSLGYFSGIIDGKFGKLTKRSVVAFQSDNDLEPTGILDAATREAMERATPQAIVRDVTEDDLRDRKSTIIRKADDLDKNADAQTGLMTLGGGTWSLETLRSASEAAQESKGALEWIGPWARENWYLALLLLGLAALWYINKQNRTKAAEIRDERVRQAVTGENLSK